MLDLYLEQRDDLYAGRTPAERRGGVTIARLVNDFLAAKQAAVDSGDLRAWNFADYLRVSKHIAKVLGRDTEVSKLTPDDFGKLRAAIASKYQTAKTLRAKLTKARSFFKWGHDGGLLDNSVRYGDQFKAPSLRRERQEQHAKGEQIFEASPRERSGSDASLNLLPDVAAVVACELAEPLLDK